MASPALIVIDVQRGFDDDEFATVMQSTEIVRE
jgi:nicotinamidase-related amidase